MKRENINFFDPGDLSKSFVYCPYSPGILVSIPKEISSIKKERRNGTDRRTKERTSRERRFLKIPSCPQYETADCPQKKFPKLRNQPDLLFSLCHANSIVRFLRNSSSRKK